MQVSSKKFARKVQTFLEAEDGTLPPYASTGQKVWYYAFRVICGFIFFFLIAPIIVIIPLSFNAQDFFTFTPEMLALSPEGYSLKHYKDFLTNDAWQQALANSVARFREQGITLPTFAALADPTSFDHAGRVGDADPQGPDARNLWRVHWYNSFAGSRVDVPEHVVLPPELTGVAAPMLELGTAALMFA